MIDTDKYEGHVADFGKMWSWSKWALLQTPTGGCSETKAEMDATSALLNDAPLLLAELKRVRKGIWDAIYLFQEAGNPKMSDKKRLETICEFLVEVYDND